MEFFKHSAVQPAPEPPSVFIHSPELDHGGYPPGCPSDTHRAGRTRATVGEMGLLSGEARREAPPAALTEPELLTFHTAAYLETLRAAQEGRHSLNALAMGLGTPDCPIFAGMYDYVRLAAGGTLTGARLILNGEAFTAFNPSGGFHHAHPSAASGFCYINDVVIAALELLKAGRRVVVLDVDVHHGDGTQEAFYDRADILTMSMHESGKTLFPGTGFETEIGSGAGRGYNVNIPLPVGTYDAAYEFAFREAVMPLLRAFDPDAVILELGMDTLAGDPLAHLSLTNNVVADLVEQVRGLRKPVLATGGGGYHLDNTVRGWALCWSVLVGEHSHQHGLSMGLGGVMLENTDWLGGLRDRVLLSDGGRRGEVDMEVNRVVDSIKTHVFPLHGLV